MKFKFLSLLSLSAVLAFSSCNSNKTSDVSNENTEASSNNVEANTETAVPKLTAADEGKVQQIGNDVFLNSIHNYKTTPNWKLLSPIPVVIDFYANWCKPCKMIAPIMEELAKEYKGRIHFVKVDTDIEGELARQFQIQGIPAIMFCPVDGEPEMSVGAMDKATYLKMIKDKFKL